MLYKDIYNCIHIYVPKSKVVGTYSSFILLSVLPIYYYLYTYTYTLYIGSYLPIMYLIYLVLVCKVQ